MTQEQEIRAFEALREQASQNFPEGMSLEEINEEIRQARYGEEAIK